MAVYYTVFFITLLLAKYIPAKDDKAYLRKLIWMFIPLFLFGALRVDFGMDYSGYESAFNSLHSRGTIDSDAHSEIGYQYLSLIMPTWRSMLILTAFMNCAAWVYLLYKYVDQKYLLLAVFLFFIAGNFTVFTPLATMRNGLAIACMLFSAKLIENRRYIWAFAIAIAAHYIHLSILLFMPIAILVGTNKEITKKELGIWVAIFFVLFLLGPSNLMNYVTGFISSYFERYDTVLDYMKESANNKSLVFGPNVLLFAVLSYQMYYNRDTLSSADNTIIRIAFIYLLCPFLGSMGSTRMQCYFIPFFIIAAVRMYSYPWKLPLIKFGFYFLLIFKFLYAFFYVWQWNNPYFVFQTYTSIF